MAGVQMQDGVLITTDEQTIVYLVEQNAARTGNGRFILSQLDSKNVFVRRDRLAWIQQALQQRQRETIFDEEEAKPARGGP